jgi:hypothetical protein
MNRIPDDPDMTWREAAQLLSDDDNEACLVLGLIAGHLDRLSMEKTNTLSRDIVPLFRAIDRDRLYGKDLAKKFGGSNGDVDRFIRYIMSCNRKSES